MELAYPSTDATRKLKGSVRSKADVTATYVPVEEPSTASEADIGCQAQHYSGHDPYAAALINALEAVLGKETAAAIGAALGMPARRAN